MKIRIFALAKELDIDSKLLIDACTKAGITIKNSALASISPEERDRVLRVLEDQRTGSTSAAAPSSSAAAPAKAAPSAGTATRDPMADVATKARPIRVMGAKNPLMVPRSRMAESEAARAAVEEAPAIETPVEAAEIAPPTEVDEVVAVEEPAVEVAAETQPEVEEQPPAEAMSQPATAAPAGSSPVKPQEAAAAPEPDRPRTASPQPARHEFLAPPMPQKKMRDMVSRGTADMGSVKPTAGSGGSSTSGGSAASAGPVKKSKPTGPLIAEIPRFKAPPSTKTPKPEEAAPQRPVQRFSVDATPKEAPLGQILRKRPETSVKKKGADEESDDKGKKHAGPGGASLQDARNQRRKVSLKDMEDENDRGGRGLRARPKPHRRSGPAALKSTAELELPLTVRSLSEGIGRPAKSIMSILWQRGDMVTINSPLEEEIAVEVCLELGVDLQIRRTKSIEDEVSEVVTGEDRPEDLQPRPPIITILGHVDHGKTTLVDKLRSANVAASEHGGITQHIAAYQVEHNGQKLTFVDTPGHAAFGEMRARGAHVTDIVVLVVAANDGVMPQTVECISHTRAAEVPMIVAMNKIDLPDRNEQRVLTDLSTQNVLASEWGGDTEVIRTSGLTGQGLSELLDTLLLTAELHEFKANPNRPASGTCLEAFRDEGRGPIAWLIVQRGTLRVGDVVLCGEAFGRIRAMYNEKDEDLQEALPSMPVKVAGLDIVPGPGEQFMVLADVEAAREAAETRRTKGRASVLATMGGKRTLEDILNAATEGQVQDLAVIVKADTPGSLEAIRTEIGKFEHAEVRVKILHQGVGGVNESDVYLASASNAVIVAFHVIADDRASLLAQQEGVEIRRYNIIYEVMDEIHRILEGMLKPEQREVATGRAIVLRTFSITRYGTIAGCRILNGNIERSSRIHLIRDQRVINTYAIASLKREKEDAREVREGMECGIRLENFNDVKEGDLLEAFKIEEVKRTL